ncbi:MAG: hypothetical protein Q7R33_04625 [Nitrosarchaeum sp.]|nr:hypothetical protein [Nitrosarchaeum sp.]
MLKIIPPLRDFLDAEQLKWLPGNLKVEQCILLSKQEVDVETNVTSRVIYVFDHEGCLIGKIENKYGI